MDPVMKLDGTFGGTKVISLALKLGSDVRKAYDIYRGFVLSTVVVKNKISVPTRANKPAGNANG